MKKILVFLLGTLFAFSACAQMDKTAETNAAMADRFAAEAWNNGNLDLIDEMIAADFVRHLPNSWHTPKIEGAAAFKEYMTNIRTIYPDFHIEVHKRIAEGDMVASAWTVSGTNKDLDKMISVRGMSMTRYADGKAAEEWVTWDTAGMQSQLAATEETSMK